MNELFTQDELLGIINVGHDSGFGSSWSAVTVHENTEHITIFTY